MKRNVSRNTVFWKCHFSSLITRVTPLAWLRLVGLVWVPPAESRLTWNFWRISSVGLWSHSSTLISGCCSKSEALGVLVCRLTLECLGSSSSSKLLNSGILFCFVCHKKTFRCTSGVPNKAVSESRFLLGLVDTQEVQLLHHGAGDQRLGVTCLTSASSLSSISISKSWFPSEGRYDSQPK